VQSRNNFAAGADGVRREGGSIKTSSSKLFRLW
jgi:hypothetical protein